MAVGKVKRVIDGDTIELKSGERVRIANFDAPELGSSGGDAAKRRLQRLLPQDSTVGLSDPVARSYGRNVRRVSKGGKDVGDTLG